MVDLFYIYQEAVANYVSSGKEDKKRPILLTEGGTMLIEVNGVLGLKNDSGFYRTDYGRIQNACDIAERHPGVNRVAFIHNSPGGSVVGMEETFGKIANMKKPTSAYSSTLMASASYALACACDFVYSSQSAIVGSIGARLMHMDVSGMLKNHGIVITEIVKGKDKNLGSPFKELSSSDRDVLQKRVDNAAQDFFTLVKDRRPNAKESVFQSNIYSGREGVRNGLIDGLLTSDNDLVKFLS